MSNFSTLALLAILFFFYRRSDVDVIFIVALFLIREEIFFFSYYSRVVKISTKRFQDSYGFVERRVGELKRKSFPWRSDSEKGE